MGGRMFGFTVMPYLFHLVSEVLYPKGFMAYRTLNGFHVSHLLNNDTITSSYTLLAGQQSVLALSSSLAYHA